MKFYYESELETAVGAHRGMLARRNRGAEVWQ